MILSSADILRVLGANQIIRAVAKLQIVDGRPPLTGDEGLYIYIDRYPTIGEFEATWKLWVIEYSDEPIDLVIEQMMGMLPQFQAKPTGLAIEVTTTELLSKSTQTRPVEASAPSTAAVDMSAFEERFQSLVEDVNDRMLLVHSGLPGRDGRDGRDGVDGAPGQDLVATEANLEDLRNVEEGIAKEKGQVLTWDGLKWTNLFIPQVFSPGGNGSSSGGGIVGDYVSKIVAGANISITPGDGVGEVTINASGIGLDANEVRELVGLDQSGAVIGHYDRTESKLEFDSNSRTFSISPAAVGGSYDVWTAGAIKRTYTTTESVQIPNTSGGYYIVFNPAGSLEVIGTVPDWPNHALTAFVYWNAATQQLVYLADERHGINMDWQVHEYLHRTRGAALANGLQISGFTVTGTGNNNADAQCNIANGTFFDEDLQVDITHSNTPAPNTWEQDLQGPARIPVLWRNGASWTLESPSDFPAKIATSRIGYNVNTGGNWTFVDVPNNQFTNVFLIATNNLNYPIIALVGQNYYTTIANARDVAFSDLNLTGFISNEFRPLYNLVFQTSTSYTNLIKGRLRDVVDLRTTERSQAGGTGVIPLFISDLGDVDTVTVPPVTGQVLKWNGSLWAPANDETGNADGGDFGELPNPDGGDFTAGTTTSTLAYPVDGGNFTTGDSEAFGDSFFDGGDIT